MSAVMVGGPALSACSKCGTSADGKWFAVGGVCVPCENERVRQRVEAQDLAHDIAFAASTARIRTMTPLVAGAWFDTNFALETDGPEAAALRKALHYLDLRGAIEPHPSYRGLFKFLPTHQVKK